MYKSAYYRVGEITRNQDFARQELIGKPDVFLTHFDEVFTSENWIVRLYKLKKPANREEYKPPIVPKTRSTKKGGSSF